LKPETELLDTLITNKTRLKLLLRFFLNHEASSYLRGLEGEFNESTNAIRIELNRFEEAGFLVSSREGKRKVFRANHKHPLYPEIHNIIRKYIGLDSIVEQIVKKLGDVKKAYITGKLARGLESQTIELVLIGNKINEEFLLRYIRKAEQLINRSIQCLILEEKQEKLYVGQREEAFLIWKAD
jgi:hypothetical protein